MSIIRLAALAVFCALFVPAVSAGAAEPRHGVAMHGEVKYGPDFTHLDYADPDAPKGGTLRLHEVGSFDSLNPFIVKGQPVAGVNFIGHSLLYEPLMTQSHDEPFSMYGLLAESIELPEDNSRVTFNLRPEARWHDGTPVTAEDVAWTFRTVMEKGSPFFKAYYGDVADVRAEGEKRVTFTFSHNENAELPLILSQLVVLPKHYWTAEGRDFASTSLEPPLGSSAYRITEVVPGRRIVYERVRDWWGRDLPINRGKFNFDTIVYEYFRDQNVALEAFLAGEYDVRLENTAKLWNTAYDVPAVRSGRIVKAEIPHGRPAGMQGFAYNTRRPVFSDPAVREALGYAFDFEWSNKQFAYGTYKRTRSYFDNSDLASLPGPPEGRVLEILQNLDHPVPERALTQGYTPPKTDGSGNNRRQLRQAMRILDEAGYALRPDGVRVHKETGVRLEFEILESNPAFERWIQALIRNLEKIGAKADLRIVDPAQYQNRMNAFDYDMTILSIGQSSSPGNEQRDFWASVKADMQGSRNYMGVKDPAIDALIEMVINAPSREELVYRTRALDRVLLWHHLVIPQWHINTWRIAYDKKLRHPETLSDLTPGIASTWWAAE